MRWVACAGLATATAVPWLVLGAGEASAQGGAPTAPKGFCAAVKQLGEADTALAKNPTVANGDRVATELARVALLGRNTPAIAQVEAQYEEMWARDVAAMFGYHGAAPVGAVAAANDVAQACPQAAIDFGVLPPEVNSGRTYAGPGSGS